jgi:hypothetical protein
MRVIFFALAALALAAAAALWSDGAGVASGDRGAASEKISADAPEIVREPASPAPDTVAGAAGAPVAALEAGNHRAESLPAPPAADADPVAASGPGRASGEAADVAALETLQLVLPAPFPEEAVPSGAAATPPEDVATRHGERAEAGSREAAPFDPEWSAALVRRLLALHRTLSE